MPIGQDMANVWHKHPYLIMGAGAVVVLYFLWPSSSSNNAQTSSNQSTDPYGQQLAAETALSQAQLAEQAATDQMQSQQTAAEYQAAAAATAGSNEAIAQSNAAAIVSYNQTLQTQITDLSSVAVAQTQASSSSFQALLTALTAFGAQNTAVETGMQGTLASVFAPAGNTGGGAAEAQATFATAQSGGQGVGGAMAGAYNPWETGYIGMIGQNPGYATALTDFIPGYGATPGPLTAFENMFNGLGANEQTNQSLMAGLWSQAATLYGQEYVAPSPMNSAAAALPTLAPIVSAPTLVGNVQPIPAPINPA